MAEEAKREQGFKGWLFRAYERFSDYGFSLRRPLGWALVFSAGLTLLYGLLSLLGNCLLAEVPDCRFAPQWLTFSLLQTLPLPGMDKLAAEAGKVFWPAGGWWELALTALVILHKTVILTALFLAGLALRNLFRLK